VGRDGHWKGGIEKGEGTRGREEKAVNR